MMMKKLLMFTLILSGFSFVSMDGNCSEGHGSSNSEYNPWSSESSDDESIIEDENNIFASDQEFNSNNNGANDDNNNSEENDDGKGNPIFKIAKELGIDVKNDDTNVVKDGNEKNIQSYFAPVDEIDYGNGYESPDDENE